MRALRDEGLEHARGGLRQKDAVDDLAGSDRDLGGGGEGPARGRSCRRADLVVCMLASGKRRDGGADEYDSSG